MTTLETLKAARKLITPPRKWTKGSMAKAADRRKVNAGSPRAVCWCSIGAILRVNPTNWYGALNVLQDTLGDIPDNNVGDWNDKSTKKVVLAAFDEAIRREEAR